MVRSFQARRNSDFAANRIVILDGWVVAEAEASICAALSLI